MEFPISISLRLGCADDIDDKRATGQKRARGH